MLGAIQHAASGIHAGLSRLDAAAGRIARDGAAGDLARDVVDVMRARQEVRANVAVARTADRTIGSLLDVLA
jgi:hypothetical protein